MKTKEFIREVNELGYKPIVREESIKILGKNSVIAWLDRKHLCEFSTAKYTFDCVPDDDKVKLLKVLYDYAITSLADREEEKKYLVKVPNEWKTEGYFRISSNGGLITRDYDSGELGFEFTEQEIKYYHLESFEKVEVKDE